MPDYKEPVGPTCPIIDGVIRGANDINRYATEVSEELGRIETDDPNLRLTIDAMTVTVDAIIHDSNMEVIDMLFDTYRKSRKFKQQPYIRPKGQGVKRWWI